MKSEQKHKDNKIRHTIRNNLAIKQQIEANEVVLKDDQIDAAA